jgi:hypothetical protein
MTELNKRTASTWRAFLASDEGTRGMAWIIERRPPLDEKNWQQAAGFEEFGKRIQDIMGYGLTGSNDDESKEDKLRI